MDKLKKLALKMSHIDMLSHKFEKLEHKLEKEAKKQLEEERQK